MNDRRLDVLYYQRLADNDLLVMDKFFSHGQIFLGGSPINYIFKNIQIDMCCLKLWYFTILLYLQYFCSLSEQKEISFKTHHKSLSIRLW